MLSSVEQAFVGRDEKRAPLKTPAWEATLRVDACFFKKGEKISVFKNIRIRVGGPHCTLSQG